MRTGLTCVLAVLALAACSKPASKSDNPVINTPETADASPPPLLSGSPYAGEWAAAVDDCGNEKQVWTIETHRMAIVPAMRFCAFKDIYVNTASGKGATTFSAAASCLAEGHETNDFVFFRVKDNLREMRVTFNDTDAVKLVRCPMKS